MLNFIIKAIFGFKTVDSVMSQFHKTIGELEQVTVQNNTIANEKLSVSARLIEEANEHLAEARRSNIIQSKLASLLSMDVEYSGDNVIDINANTVVDIRNENSAVEKVMAK